ncbi:uncharacterized protein LOC125039341 [Penaeus chinensis]|uniref:uncharacterized protein LOC125039341 n=1 Tax=Penaeus chinensis TaxID=139456 RepID=UPI001FB7D2F6|nr:uncharacterized protein LOC125039341 [Penaeus chinensis]
MTMKRESAKSSEAPKRPKQSRISEIKVLIALVSFELQCVMKHTFREIVRFGVERWTSVQHDCQYGIVLKFLFPNNNISEGYTVISGYSFEVRNTRDNVKKKTGRIIKRHSLLVSSSVSASALVGGYGTHIVGGRERFLQAGSSLSLECVVTHTRAPPTAVLWYHNSDVLDYDSPRGGIALQVEKSGDQTTSSLLLSSVRDSDSGNYTCVPVNAPTASVSVHVNNDELRAAVHQGGISSASVLAPRGVGRSHLLLLLLLSFLVCCFSSSSFPSSSWSSSQLLLTVVS